MSVRDEVLSGLELQSVYLHECQVTRHNVETAALPSKVDFSGALGHSEVSEAALTYVVKISCEFQDDAGQGMITIDIAMAAVYSVVEGLHLGDDDFTSYGNECVTFQVHPYLREMLSSLTSRIGLPTYSLPVLRRDMLD